MVRGCRWSRDTRYVSVIGHEEKVKGGKADNIYVIVVGLVDKR